MDADEADFVYFGAPIEREEDTSIRKRKAAADAGQLRALPSWKQEVRDEEGRRRFHGAFTGGFSAGYYNTVGSKEGWVPQSFTSSRKNRAEVKQQSIFSFLDEDEKEELGDNSLKTLSKFDTFGFTAAEVARKQAEKEQNKRPSIIPGPIPEEIVLPAANSIGIKLLLKMGWRHGHSIKDSHNSLYDAHREARKAFLALSGNSGKLESIEVDGPEYEHVKGEVHRVVASPDIPEFVMKPKRDLHGLGFDPFKHAPEFRERKEICTNRSQGHKVSSLNRRNLFSSNSGKVVPGFGIGALEELDFEDDDIYDSAYYFNPKYQYKNGLGTNGDLLAAVQIVVEKLVKDEKLQIMCMNEVKYFRDALGSFGRITAVNGRGNTLPGFEVTDTCLEDIDPPSKASRDTKMLLDHRSNDQSGLAGFKHAQTNSGYKTERFPLPNVPHNFDPQHKFSSPLDAAPKLLDFTPPPEVPPPSDCTLRMLIEGFATLVCRCGKLFEDLSREKNKDNPLFSFLSGGHGHEYYAWMLWESQQKHIGSNRLAIDIKPSSNQKMTAESRGRVLGERPLEKSTFSVSSANQTIVHFQSNLSDTFTKPASHSNAELAKPFKDDPSKQARFEQFLKDKFEGGLRSTYSGSTSSLSEADRARERLDFEAALETIQKGEPVKASEQEFNKSLFITAGVEMSNHIQKEEIVLDKIYPRREEFQWRPAPVLCKRFDIIDPFMGKPPPLPRARSRMESLVFTSDFVKMSKSDEAPAALKASSAVDVIEIGQQIHAIEPDEESAERSVQKPVDLYKAIFSDDSDDDDNENGENPIENPSDLPEKKTEGVNTALNRLVAGDFLESLGRELGLDVPTDMVKSSRTPTILGMADSHSLSKQHKFSTAKTDDTAASREVSANRQVKPPGDEDNYQAHEHNIIVDAVDHMDLQNRAMHLGYSTESEKGMSKTIGSQIIETKLEMHASHTGHLLDDGCPDGDLPADRTFQGNSKGRAGMDRAEIQLDKDRTTSRHHTSGSSPYRDSARGLHKKKQRSRSRHQRYSESDTESSDEHHASRRYSSTKKSQEHKQRHRDRSEKSSKSRSSHRGERDPSHDERESEKSRGHHKVSVSSRSDSHKKHR